MRLDPRAVAGALWALLALGRVRRALRAKGIAAGAVRPPRHASPAGTRGVTSVLRRRNATCLERSLVLQGWLCGLGIARDVIIGVTAPAEGFTAHAWLEGEPDGERQYRELHRLSP